MALDIAKQVRASALAGYGPAIGVGVAGLAGSRATEKLVYKTSGRVFGVDDGVTQLTTSQRYARVGAKGALMVVDGFLLTRKNPAAQALGFGLAIGHGWHLLNDAGVNL